MNAFTINQHYLTHVPALIELYGPLRLFSARPNERLNGLLKARIRSTSKPAASACNAMIDMTLTSQFYRQQYVSMENQQSDDSIPASTTEPESIMIQTDDENENMFLSNIYRTSIGRLDVGDYIGLKEQIIAFYARHDVNCTELEDEIQVGSELTVRGHIFSTKTRQGSKDNKKFVKLTLPFDVRAKRGRQSTKRLEWGDTFGQICLLFSHIQNGKQRILVFTRLELDTASTLSTNIPAGSHSRQRYYVTDASYLDCGAMELQSLLNGNKHYYIYPTMCKHKYLDSSKI